jgi:predicted 2-oxoglutarate/Fe(II)-dependent dioxygenase YbiX
MSRLRPGELAPNVQAATASNPHYNFHTVAGRPVLLVFPSSSRAAATQTLVADIRRCRAAFDDERLSLFVVARRPDDAAALEIADPLPGIRTFLDYDGRVTAAFGFAPPADGPAPDDFGFVLLDRALRCLQTVAIPADSTASVVPRLIDGVQRLAAWQASQPNINHAPVLVVERVFEPGLCKALIDYYGKHGGEESGFMREKDGLTVGQLDFEVKRRQDCLIEDEPLRNAAMNRVNRSIVPMIRRAFQFEATRIERHIVARYDANDGGFFRAHRDNTTKGTAHRRFAVTINLNAEQYEGGDLRLPEFGSRAYRAPTGGAVVFSCSLLHEALPVTRGTRYAYLPFLYGEADAELRQRNLPFVADPAGAAPPGATGTPP